MLRQIKGQMLEFRSFKNRRKSDTTTSEQQYVYSRDQEKNRPKLSRPKSSLFRYASCCDMAAFIFAIFLSCLSGCGIASYAIIVGQVVNFFVIVINHKDPDFHQSLLFMGLMIAVGCGLFLLSFVQYYIYHAVGVRIVSKIRCDYLKSLLHQDLAFYDGEHNELTNNIEKIRTTLSDTIGSTIRTLVQLICCLTASFLFCWHLAVALIILVPFVILWSEIMRKITEIFAEKEAQLSVDARNHAEEILDGVRIVQAFNAQQFETERYEKKLISASRYATRKNIMNGIAAGVLHMSIYLYLFGGTLYGAWLYQEYAVFHPGDIFVVLASIPGCAFPLSGIKQQILSIWSSRAAAETIYKIIDNQPKINPMEKIGRAIKNVSGEIEFADVWYNRSKNVAGLKGVSFQIHPGETVAFIGEDDSDDIFLLPDLISRIYDVDKGEIRINGNNIQKLNVTFLRSIVASMEKDPELFNCTVDDNIRMGNSNISDDEIVAFAKLAEAHDFIQDYRNGYKTLIVDDDELPSIEQRQRISLARELARQPKILVLNETGGLVDLVKRLLGTMIGNGCLILVTTRVDVARKADRIFVMEEGQIVENGTHEDLMTKNGKYAELYEKGHFKFPQSEAEEIKNLREEREIGSTFLKKSLLVALRKEFTHIENYSRNVKITGEKISKTYNFMDLVKLTLNHKFTYSIAFFFCFLNAFGIPLYTKINGEYFEIYETPRRLAKQHSWLRVPKTGPFLEDGQDFFWRTTQISKYYIISGIVCSISLAIYIPLFGKIGECITTKLRVRLFSVLLNKDGPFYDSSVGNTENLMNLLNKDTANCRAAIDLRLGQFFNTISTLGIAYSCSLQKNIVVGAVTSMCFFVQPVIQYLAARLEQKKRKEVEKLHGAGEVAMEALERIKTVQALNCQQHFCHQFEIASRIVLRAKLKLFLFEALKFACSNGLPQITTGFAYILGYITMWGDFLHNPLMIHRITQTLLPSANNGPYIAAFLEELESTRIAASNVMPLIKERTKISEDKENLIDIHGDIEFKHVKFAYPKQPNRLVLHDISLSIDNGRTMAIVGPPDCGKGTLFSLLERFYRPNSGQIFIDGYNLSQLDINNIRGQMALVEPHVFSGTIAENIGYGIRIDIDVQMMDIVEAAKEANLDSIVSTMPDGYATKIGIRGKQLTNGHKQRIALARALLRNPKILLFNMPKRDIDGFSEKALYEALEKIRIGRTCLIVSRQPPPSDVFDDIIYIDKGRVIGETFEELPELPHLHHKHHRTARKISGVTRLYLWDPPAIQMGLL